MWESESALEPLVAIRLFFDPNTTEKIWLKVGPQINWYHPGIRSTFFWSLPGRNPSSKLLLALLPMIAKNCPDGISPENFDYLQQCKYFKESMLTSAGVVINEDEEE